MWITKLFSSIRFRIIFITILLVTAGLFEINLLVQNIVQDYLIDERVREDMSYTQITAVEAAGLLESMDAVRLHNLAVDSSEIYGGRFLVLDNSGVVLIDSFSEMNGAEVTSAEVNDVINKEQPQAHGFYHQKTETGQREWVAYYTSSISYKSQQNGVLLYVCSVQDVMDRVEEITLQSALITFIIAVLISIFIFFLSKLIVRPIEQISESVRLIGEGDFSQKVQLNNNDEFAILADSVNKMGDRLNNLDKARNQFVSDASHELKTPLASMKVLAESLLQNDNVPEKYYREFLGDINSEIDRLNRIISDLLVSVKLDSMDSQEIPFETENVDLQELLTDAVRLLRPLANEKNIELVLESEKVNVIGNATQLHQLAMNLLSNAVKYSGNNSNVHVKAYIEGGNAVISFKDEGIGMSKEEVSHLFERFYRADKARSRSTGGTGLGLAICKSIVRLHKGSIEVESEPGIGSTFTVKLPLSDKEENQ